MPIYKTNGKKDGLQKYKVRINYTTTDGNFKQLTRIAYGFDEAKDVEQKLLKEIKEKQDGSLNKTTIDQLFTEYLSTKKHDVREATSVRYEQIYRLYIKPILEHTKLVSITIPLLQKWKSYIEELDIVFNNTKSRLCCIENIIELCGKDGIYSTKSINCIRVFQRCDIYQNRN